MKLKGPEIRARLEADRSRARLRTPGGRAGFEEGAASTQEEGRDEAIRGRGAIVQEKGTVD